jgi:hypothetical protein
MCYAETAMKTTNPLDYKYNLTQTDLRRHFKRTRQTHAREICTRYKTQSYTQASYLDTADLCARIQDKTELAQLCKQAETATLAGDFALGASLGRQIQRLKAKL